MTRYDYESFDWLEKKKHQLEYELEMVNDLIEKILDARKQDAIKRGMINEP